MSLQIMYGAAGSGKSTRLQENIISDALKNPRKNYILIVPDQFTMQTQMDIVKRHPNGGIMNIDVLSFNRLCYRVFSETGKPDFPVLDDTGKSLVLRNVASTVSARMPYIGHNLNKIGYIHEVKSSISEFMQYGLSVKDIERLSAECEEGLLKTKLSDLSVIYDAFMTFNRDRFITSEETLDILCKKLPEADFIKNSVIAFDGFTGFTPIQERVILKLLELADKVIVTLTLSKPETLKETGGQEKLFFLSRRTANRLINLATDNHIEIAPSIEVNGTEGRFSKNPELKHLEENLFRYPYRTYSEKPENISMFSADNIDDEVSEIALRIHELVRTGNYAYRDIAVVVGNMEGYAAKFEERFRELDIPAFIDKTSGITLNPFTEYLRSALQIIIKDYSYDSVFHFLRSGFTDFTENEIDRFDKYVTSLNLRGSSVYHKEFKKRQKGMPREVAERERPDHEALRKRLVEALAPLERDSKTAGDYAKNMYEFLKANNSYEKLLEYEAYFNEQNDLSKGREYAQIYRLIMELLETIIALIGDEVMSLDEFYRIFDAGISEVEVGTIPRNVDRVVVGDIERTRLNEVKALFFAGVNDGNIPKNNDKGGILSNLEREKLSERGYELAPTPREEMYTQKLYLYMNLCKPTEKLFVSYAGTDTGGESLRPSYLIDVLKKLYNNFEPLKAETKITADRLVTLKDGIRYYAELLRGTAEVSLTEAEKRLTAALMALYRENNDNGLNERLMDAAFKEYTAEPLSKEIIRLIYGATLNASISRMEKYAGCAYAFFLQYGMGLKEEENYDFETRDLGNIYHSVLDIFFGELEKRGLTIVTLPNGQGKELVDEAVRIYCNEYEQGILGDDAESEYMVSRIVKVMLRTIETLQFQAKRGKFVPESHEYAFERMIELENNRSLRLNGKIDRIDLYEDDGRIFVKIIDYKTGDKDIDVTDIYHGLSEQLPVYLSEAVKREKELHPEADVIPSALLYYQVNDPIVTADGLLSDEGIEEKIHGELAMKGIVENSAENFFNLDEGAAGKRLVLPASYKEGRTESGNHDATREELENMMDYTDRLIRSMGTRIYEGDIAISPMKTSNKDACKYCSYAGICRFDEKIPGYKARDGAEIKKEDARKIVMGGEDNGIYTFS